MASTRRSSARPTRTWAKKQWSEGRRHRWSASIKAGGPQVGSVPMPPQAALERCRHPRAGELDCRGGARPIGGGTGACAGARHLCWLGCNDDAPIRRRRPCVATGVRSWRQRSVSMDCGAAGTRRMPPWRSVMPSPSACWRSVPASPALGGDRVLARPSRRSVAVWLLTFSAAVVAVQPQRAWDALT